MKRGTGPLLLIFAAILGTARVPAAETGELATPPAVSSPMWESHPAIDPLTRDFWFVRSDPTFSGWKIYRSSCIGQRLRTPTEVSLAGGALEADPWFERDGRTMWFISTGPGGQAHSAALDIWRRSRLPGGGWSRAERVPPPVNSPSAEWFPRLGPDGWLYFGSRRPGGLGKDDIWRAKRTARGHWEVENENSLNSAGAEYEFAPAPSGKWGILSTDQGLFRVVRSPAGWRRAGKLGPGINVNGTEIGPLFLGEHELLFSRDAGPARSGELFVARLERRAGTPRAGTCIGGP